MSRESLNPARTEVLASIRRALGVADHDVAARRRAFNRDSDATDEATTEATRPSEEDVLAFIARAEAAGATVERLKRLNEIPRAAAKRLAVLERRTLRLGDDARLAAAPWNDVADAADFLDVRPGGVREASESPALIRASAGVVESGAIVVASSGPSPLSLCLLARDVLAALRRDDLIPALEHLRGRPPFGNLADESPRAAIAICGPSRTADIEQTLILGAHGPKTLHILLTEEEETIP